MSDEPVYQLTLTQRTMILLTVVLSTTIYAGSVLISSALLPQLQGAMSATQDEVSWVMTFNIVATAVATPATGWLADRFGQREVMIAAALFFGISTFMCGASNSLEELIFWRILQGAAGAPLVPLGQTLLLDSSPRSQHVTVMSIFGMSNMIGPSLGPMFAGEIAEIVRLALGLLDARAGGRRGCHRLLVLAAAQRDQAGHAARLARASSVCRRGSPPARSCSRAASGSTGSRAARSCSPPCSAA